ncbi:hypothetical protein CKAN_01493200 [Cinnamomum micranthum f. kanehirae]|uniref:Uncharacterized protein n=1 Tax=Cinnamomum micranthum f. kanehirae TaxID=337451 RepID=A0A3S3QJF8_9MAGN|nr:hypothetical protein CKAN_01493200 [Cinnamomum micranthum f. kanehirae]
MEKESVFKVLLDPHKVYDFVGDLKKKYGVEFGKTCNVDTVPQKQLLEVMPNFGSKMIDDQDLGFFANFLGIFIFIMTGERSIPSPLA